MFNKQNFCHVASNNRNEQKAGLFVYKTTDDLDTVLQSGYFNEKLIDINLHDFIIHEQTNASDKTKVQRNLLCVVERTLDNVGTKVVKSNWEETIEETIANLQEEDLTFVKLDGSRTMTGPLKFSAGSMRGAIAGGFNGLTFFKMDSEGNITQIGSLSDSQFVPAADNTLDIGTNVRKVERIYLGKVNNGYDIDVPVTNSADTLALKSQVDLAANSGSQLYNTGVWYAKMYAATVVPTGAEYDGRNYADFSQVDGDNNPIIVIYEGQSGAWVQIATITPPATYNGYITVTSKIWDIAEQSGQQGGEVLWAYNTKTFTPYPKIISFENAALTGTPTAPNLSVSSPNNQIVNKQSLEDALQNHGTGRNVADIFLTMRTDNGLNGAVECNGGTYDTTNFTGAESIGNLLNAGKVPFVSLATYASTVAAKGWCDKIGWDGIGTTTFRVPTLTPHIVETNGLAIAGNGISLGLTDGTQELGLGYYASNSYYTGAAKNNSGQTVGSTFDGNGTTLSNKILGVSTDATKSGIVGDVSDEWQPRVMIQLMVSATDEAVATCTAVTAQVAANTSAIAGADYVVESQLPTADNDYTWSRLYKSGWVEQGQYGHIQRTSAQTTINLPVEMADDKYTVLTAGTVATTYSSLTTTSFVLTTTANQYAGWEVKGMSAQ